MISSIPRIEEFEGKDFGITADQKLDILVMFSRILNTVKNPNLIKEPKGQEIWEVWVNGLLIETSESKNICFNASRRYVHWIGCTILTDPLGMNLPYNTAEKCIGFLCEGLRTKAETYAQEYQLLEEFLTKTLRETKDCFSEPIRSPKNQKWSYFYWDGSMAEGKKNFKESSGKWDNKAECLYYGLLYQRRLIAATYKNEFRHFRAKDINKILDRIQAIPKDVFPPRSLNLEVNDENFS